VIGAAASLSNSERTERLEVLFRQDAATRGEICVLLGEVARCEAFRHDGATSTESWVCERFGVSAPTARTLTHVGERAADVPHLVGSMCGGEVSLDKVRAVIDVATPETDEELAEQAKACTVRQLADVAQLRAPRVGPTSGSGSRSEHEHHRRYLRCNDAHRTMSLQLPAESYAEARACLDALAKQVAPDVETSATQVPLDQRRCDGFMALVRSATPGGSASLATSPFVVVLHAPLDAVVDETGTASELAGELERDGLVDAETVRRVACDATVILALDDDVGHTMYEGRARRFPSASQRREVMRRDRHCRFPGCPNATFTNVHHIVAWKPGGRTDLPNLVLMCEHHHGVVHRRGWKMSGNANEELTIVGPTGRVMVSRPSPLWTTVTTRRGPAGSRAAASASG